MRFAIKPVPIGAVTPRSDTPVVSEQTPLLTDNTGSCPTNEPPSRWKPKCDQERTIICHEISSVRLALIMGTAWFGVFIGAADSTIIATLSGPISSEFNSLSLLSYLGTAYLISTAASQPISGRLTDIFGRGPGLVLSNAIFATGNLLCGLATSQGTLVFGRLIAGFGGGGLMSIPTFLASDLVPLRNRALVGGIANLWYGAGAMVGAVLGGVLNDYAHWGWRMAFLIQVPPSILSAFFVHFLVRVPPKQSDKSFLKRIDFVGVLLCSSFLALLVLGLSSGGNTVPWTHPLPPTAIFVSLVLAMIFIYWESWATQPVVPVQLLIDRTIATSCLASVFCAGIALTSLFYVPLYLQVRGDTATMAGLKILPASVGTSAGALGAGYIMRRTGRYKGLVIFSTVVLVIGTALFDMQDGASPYCVTFVGFLLVGAGYNAVFSITQVACIAAVDPAQQAVVTSSTYLARSLGGTIGLTTASVLFENAFRSGLDERFGTQPNALEDIRKIRNNLSALHHLPDGWHDGVVISFIEAFRHVWILMLFWGVLALVSVSPIKQHRLCKTINRR